MREAETLFRQKPFATVCHRKIHLGFETVEPGIRKLKPLSYKPEVVIGERANSFLTVTDKFCKKLNIRLKILSMHCSAQVRL